MVLGRDLIAAPATIAVRFEVNPVLAFSNALIIAHYERDTGLDGGDKTLHRFLDTLPPERQETHGLVYGMLGNAIPYVGEMSFPDFLRDFAGRDPVALRDSAIHWMQNHEGFPGIEAVLDSEAAFLTFMAKIAEGRNKDHEPEPIKQAYPYLIDPPRMKAFMLEHMTFLWDTILQKEWRKHEASMRQCVEAFRQKNYEPFTSGYDAVETITGRDMRYGDKMKDVLTKNRRFAFVPSPYLGPYLSWHDEFVFENKEAFILFGARLPDGIKKSVFTSRRAELLVWMNSLADETRLQMLEMLLEEGEICAQDFIDRLNLSQSSASRHLRQLVTAGFITARRQDVAKCYTLNQERIGELVQVLQHFTGKKSS